jgi:carbonic anhydrase
MCENGLNQSPINITRPIDASLSPLIFEELGKATTFINNEHMLQVNFQGVNSVTIDDKRYNLKQINFHSPSENKINGKSFPMEAQLIHMDSNNNPLIIALMFQEGDDNFILNRLLRNLPKKANVIEEIKSEVLAYKILPDLKEYYLFNGSITTPPCTEGVKWLVLKNPVQISKSQLKDFTLNIPKNARDTQKLNARIILE